MRETKGFRFLGFFYGSSNYAKLLPPFVCVVTSMYR